LRISKNIVLDKSIPSVGWFGSIVHDTVMTQQTPFKSGSYNTAIPLGDVYKKGLY